MKLQTFDYKGQFEQRTTAEAEPIQLVQPENEFEENLLRWSILPRPMTVEDPEAEEGMPTVFVYELGEHLKDGLFKLHITERTAGGESPAGECVAALAVASPLQPGQAVSFTPYWLLSEHLHVDKPSTVDSDFDYKRSFGHLRFGDDRSLPHRKLFALRV
ncbi:MAG: hypothetical protein ACLFUJ_11865 [Phycisphaerae bacterium]